MRIGIDASNLRGGGGLTHLLELLRVAQPHEHGFREIITWGGIPTLSRIADRSWLRKVREPLLDRALPYRLYWQQFVLGRLAHFTGCDVLLVPGGSYSGGYRPFVTMCRNMLPFEWSEARRYGVSWLTLKFLLLRVAQLATFRRAAGLIFLTDYARSTVMRLLGRHEPQIRGIPHGVDRRFFQEPRSQKPISWYSRENPYRLLYVSPVAPYKHQWNVIESVWHLRRSGLPVTLDLVGPVHQSRERLLDALERFDPERNWVCCRGAMAFDEIHAIYHQSDLFVFASSCENLPNILLEAMASGLPIACSQRGPMPEVLGPAGVYFDPEQPAGIAEAVNMIVENPALREHKAWAAYERAKAFTWERCAHETFAFLSHIAKQGSQLAG